MVKILGWGLYKLIFGFYFTKSVISMFGTNFLTKTWFNAPSCFIITTAFVLIFAFSSVSNNGTFTIVLREYEDYSSEKDVEGEFNVKGRPSSAESLNKTSLLQQNYAENGIHYNQSKSYKNSLFENRSYLKAELSIQSETSTSNENEYFNATFFENHYYQLFSIELTWSDAKDYCESLAGHLVTITSEEENSFVDTLTQGNSIWIGFTDEQIEGEWAWVTNEPVTYVNWNQGEPNDAFSGEDYAELLPFDGWNDNGGPADPDYSIFFVCEWSSISDDFMNSTIEPFVIQSNTDFVEVAATNNWSGNGTEINPYIIENHTIYGYFNDCSIGVRITNLYFLIRNCTFIGGPCGIIFSNVTNGQISNSRFVNSDRGIYLSESANCTIQNNSFTSIYRKSGIILNSSGNNLLLNNSFNNTGLILLWSGWNTVSYNNFTNSGLTVFGWTLEQYIQSEVEGNSVYNLPIIFWQNKHNLNVLTEAGQVILVNCSNVDIRNQQISDISVGIRTAFSNNVDILNNSVSDAKGYCAISFYSTRNSTIKDNTITNASRCGIQIINSEENLIINNLVINSGRDGINIQNSAYMGISDNNCLDNKQNGIQLNYATFGNIIGNIFSNNDLSGILIVNCTNMNLSTNICYFNLQDGMYLDNINYSFITGNSCSENSWYGINSWNSTEIFISNNKIFFNYQGGVLLEYNSEISLVYNQIEDNGDYGIRFYCSNKCTILYNSIKGTTGDSIYLQSSDSNTFQENDISEASNGIVFDNSINCIIINNSITFIESKEGVILYSSENNEVTGNSFRESALVLSWAGNTSILDNSFTKYGITIVWETIKHFLQAEVVNNDLDGNPIIFWQHETKMIVPSDSKQVFLINCTQIEVSNISPSDIGDGIIAAFCENIIIRDNVITTTNGNAGIALFHTNHSLVENNSVSQYTRFGISIIGAKNDTINENNVFNTEWAGIYIENSEQITLSENNCYSNMHGFFITNSKNIIISENEINRNLQFGIYIYKTSESIITHCIIDENRNFGVFFEQTSNGNEVYLNDFLRNNPEGFSQAYDDGEENEFYNNYWNEWDTPDTNEDGVVDFPYSIEGIADNFDHLPRTISSKKKFYEPIPQNLLYGLVFFILISLLLLYLTRK